MSHGGLCYALCESYVEESEEVLRLLASGDDDITGLRVRRPEHPLFWNEAARYSNEADIECATSISPTMLVCPGQSAKATMATDRTTSPYTQAPALHGRDCDGSLETSGCGPTGQV